MKISVLNCCAALNRSAAWMICAILAMLASGAGASLVCPGDTNGNNIVDVDDLLVVIEYFESSGGGASHGDVNGDGHTDMADIMVVLSHFADCANTAAPAWKGSPLRYLAMEPVADAPSHVDGHAVKVYRLMAHGDAGTRLDAVYAAGAAHLSVGPGAGLSFFQALGGGETSNDINPAIFEVLPAVQWDSYVTIGALYSTSNSLLTQGMSWSNWGTSGHPLTADNGGWYVTPDTPQCHESGGKVCLGQFTVINGSGVGHNDVIGAINVHGRDADGHYWSRENVGWVVHDVCPSGCTYNSVLTAIEESSNGHVVTVGAGTYNEHFINTGGKAITIIGEPVTNGNWTSVISRNGVGPVMVFENHETSATIFRDVEITGGHTVNGGGIITKGASPTFQRCLITSNTASGNGGGMYNHDGGRPTLNNCIVRGNTAAGKGGGIYSDGASPVLNHTTVSGNTASSGGGVASAASPTRGETEELMHPTLNNCIVCDNSGGQVEGSANHSGDTHVHAECSLNYDPGDLDGDGDIDIDDLELHHAATGTCHHDVNHNGLTDIDDLLLVIEGWASGCTP